MADVEAYALHSGAQRVIGYLLRDVDTADGAAPDGVTVSLPASKFVLRHVPSRIVADTANAPAGSAAIEAPRLRVDHVAASLALALGICAVSRFLIDRFDPSFGHYYLFVVTAVTVALATSMPKFAVPSAMSDCGEKSG